MWNAYLKLSSVLSIVTIHQRIYADGLAIAPPSWSDPEVNPCARFSNGWQHLFYEPLQACFKIFTMGFPCPDTMELSPLKNGLTGYGKNNFIIMEKKLIKNIEQVNAAVHQDLYKQIRLQSVIKYIVEGHVMNLIMLIHFHKRKVSSELCASTDLNIIYF